MKKVLSSLLVLVFLHTQAFALSGGPVFNTGGGPDQGAFVGTYSGVLMPNGLDETDTSTNSDSSTSSVGLFSFAQPTVGVATGALVVFIDGAAFNCLLTGVIDPLDGSFRGVIDGLSTFTVGIFTPQTNVNNGVTTTTFVREEFSVFASGNVDAEVFAGIGGVSSTGTPFTPARITGTASIDVFFRINIDGTPQVSKTATFDVDGFRQTLEANAASFTVGSNFQNQNQTGG